MEQMNLLQPHHFGWQPIRLIPQDGTQCVGMAQNVITGNYLPVVVFWSPTMRRLVWDGWSGTNLEPTYFIYYPDDVPKRKGL